MAFCQNCRKEVSVDDAFCSNCGFNLGAQIVAPTPPIAPAMQVGEHKEARIAGSSQAGGQELEVRIVENVRPKEALLDVAKPAVREHSNGQTSLRFERQAAQQESPVSSKSASRPSSGAAKIALFGVTFIVIGLILMISFPPGPYDSSVNFLVFFVLPTIWGGILLVVVIAPIKLVIAWRRYQNLPEVHPLPIRHEPRRLPLVFIAHSFRDVSYKDVLKETLRERGIEAYAAEERLRIGTSIQDKVLSKIRESDYVVAIYTKANPSGGVDQEVGIAQGFKKPVIPMVEKGAKPGFMIQQLDRQEFEQTNFDRACERIAKEIAQSGDE